MAKKSFEEHMGTLVFDKTFGAMLEEQLEDDTKKAKQQKGKEQRYKKWKMPTPGVDNSRFRFNLGALGNVVDRIRRDFEESNFMVTKITNITRPPLQANFTQAWRTTPGDVPILW